MLNTPTSTADNLRQRIEQAKIDLALPPDADDQALLATLEKEPAILSSAGFRQTKRQRLVRSNGELHSCSTFVGRTKRSQKRKGSRNMTNWHDL